MFLKNHKLIIHWTLFLGIFSVAMSASSDVVITEIISQLQEIQRSTSNRREETQMPMVTVSFAQSLDAKLAPYNEGSSHTESVGNFPLSGLESIRMTHAIRSMHDGILIGGNTLELDNPRLTNRLWPDASQSQPIPIVLDSNLDHLNKLATSLNAQDLIVCCSERAADSLESLPHAVLLCPCPCLPNGQIDLKQTLKRLYQQHHIKSLMVEGGARTISSFLAEDLIDALCITITPKILADGLGIEYRPSIIDLTAQSHVYQLGKDSIYLSLLKRY